MCAFIVDVPHVRQPKGSTQCGAACLAMVYRYFDQPIAVDEIWKNVKGKAPKLDSEVCMLNLMLCHAMKQGFIAHGVAVENPLDMIRACLPNDISVISLYTTNAGVPHYSVISGYDDGCVYLNDPNEPPSIGKRRRVGCQAFLRSIEPPTGSQIGLYPPFLLIARKNTPLVSATVFCPAHSALLETMVFSALISFHPNLVCPDHSCWCCMIDPGNII
mgnify:CR=1 FL=1